MRISDCSSDVCSSALRYRGEGEAPQGPVRRYRSTASLYGRGTGADAVGLGLPATDVCAWALRRSCAWPAVRLNATGRPLAGHCDRITGSAIQLLTIAAHFEASDRAVVNLIQIGRAHV